MSKWQYVAMFETGEKGKNYFKFLQIEAPDGYILPPIIEASIPHQGIVQFIYAPDQESIAKAFNTSQQNVSRWLKNRANQ